MIYYEEDNERKSVAPDVFVVFGARDVKRSSYFLWEEPKAPDFVLEITSRSTWRKGSGEAAVVSSAGVREYCQYDPTRDYLEHNVPEPLRELGLLDDDAT